MEINLYKIKFHLVSAGGDERCKARVAKEK